MSEMFDEPQQDEDYSLEQLKEAVLRRRASMDRIKNIYKEDPRASMTPFMAGLEAHVARPSAGGRGTSSYAELMGGIQGQREFLFQNKLQPELLQQKHDETDPFTEMLRKVTDAKAKSYKPDVKVVGNSLVKYDSATDSTQVLFSDVRNSPLYAKIWDQIHVSSLKDNMAFTNDAQRRAYVTEQTNKEFANAVSKDSTVIGPQTPPMGSAVEMPKGPLTNATQTGRPTMVGTTPAMVRPQTDLRKESAVKGAIETAPGGVANPDSPNVFGDAVPLHNVPDVSLPVGKQRVAQVEPKIRSPQELATDAQIGKNYAEENTNDRSALSNLREMDNSLSVLAEIINSGVHTSGPAHELLNKAGGYLNYIDPNGSLAKSTGNDAVYFSNMMNLVREKIKALGAGTAVSNLDLIVTQKSVGDLRNTPEGNKKLLAIMALQNATMGNKLNNKLAYFDQNRSYDKYRGSGEPSHLVRRSPKTGDYWVQSREDWINEQVKAKRGTREEAEKAFSREAVAATARLIKGTSIKMGGK